MENTQQGVEKFSDENLTLEVTKKPHCQVKFDIKVGSKAVQAAHAKALKNVRKEVSIPGFRKGKAPDQMINEKYGSAVQKEWVDVVLQTAFSDALQLSQIHPMKDGNIKRPVVHECSMEKGAHVTIEFESRPQIPVIDLSEIKITKVIPHTVTDKEMDNALRNVALQFATYEPTQDKAVEAGDFIDVDVDLIMDNGSTKRVIENQKTQVAESGLPVWIRDKVIGLRVGESAEGQTEQDPNQHNPDFKPAPFKATVNAISKGTIPEIDDELAKKVGLQSAEELKKFIREKLEEQVKEEASQRELFEIEQLLLHKFPIEIPRSLINEQKQARMKNYMAMLADKKQGLPTDREQIDAAMERSTINYFQMMFIFRKLAADHDIKLNNDDISQEFNRQLTLMSSGRQTVDFNDKEGLRDQIYTVALNRKIEHFLLDHATFVS